jgi:hypothetical protein
MGNGVDRAGQLGRDVLCMEVLKKLENNEKLAREHHVVLYRFGLPRAFQVPRLSGPCPCERLRA